jgi:hypothetical protein
VLLALAGCGRDEGVRDTGSSTEPTRVFLAGDGELTVVDVDAHRAQVRQLPELAPGDPLYRIVRRGDKLVLFGVDTFVVDVGLSHPPRKLGDSSYFVPSQRPDRVWLAAIDPSSPETVRAVAVVREVFVDSRVTVREVRPPDGRGGPLAAVGDHLVFQDRLGALELWNPATRTFTRRFPGGTLGPTHGDLLAWCEGEGRVLHVTDVESGDDRTIDPPDGFAAFDCWSGAFSPDGKSLAVGAMYEESFAGTRTLTLVDPDDGSAEPVDGSSVDPHYVYVAWSRAGDRVFISGGDADRELVQYRLGDADARRIPVKLGAFYGMAAR